jgi:hypothetical protein
MEITSDEIVTQLNVVLQQEELNLIKQFSAPKLPVIFIVGAPRSGTTVLEQFLINHFHLTYISNVVAKFWQAPFIGLHFYKSLKKKQTKIDYSSEFGFTNNYDGPHEFGYFWKRFFKYGSTHQLTEDHHNEIDSNLLNREIAAMESLDNLPVLFKNPAALSLQIDYLSKYIPGSLFIYIKREPVFNAQSIYQNRIKYFGNAEEWFSVKPMEYLLLKNENLFEQIAGQIYYVNKKIEEDLSELHSWRHIKVEYEEFCGNTAGFCSMFNNWLNQNNYSPRKKEKCSDDDFRHNNKISVSSDVFEKLQTSCNNFKSQL